MPLPSHEQQTAEAAQGVHLLEIPWFLRLVYCGLGIGMLALLVVARLLQPSPEGLGTHQQLFDLPPCGFIMFLGLPCPSCGMTTAWAHFTRGHLIQAWHANAGGMLLALFALPIGIWLVRSGWRGRWWLRNPNTLILAAMLATIIAAALIQWAIRFG